MTIRDAFDFISNVPADSQRKEIASAILKEIEDRLKFMLNVGLDYLSLKQTSQHTFWWRSSTYSFGITTRI